MTSQRSDRSSGDDAPPADDRALHATFLFSSARDAKRAWERAAERCRGVSLNRWLPDPSRPERQAVTVIADGDIRSQRTFAQAVELLGRDGRRVPTPPGPLAAMRAKRAQVQRAGQTRRMVRTPGGSLLDPSGRQTPLRRGQG